MAENIPVSNANKRSRKDSFRERLAGKHADNKELNLDDEESMYGQIDDDYNDYENQIKGYQDDADKLGKMFADDPRSAAFFSAWSQGGNPIVEVIKRYGPEILEAAQDPSILKDIEAASKEYNDMVAQGKEIAKQYDDNFAKSVEAWKQYADENGVGEKEATSALVEFAQAQADFEQGNFTPENVMRFMKGGSYDNDIAAARRDGEIEGKNQKIEEKVMRDERKKASPMNLGGGGSTRSQAAPDDENMGVLGRMGRRQSIWDKGKK